MKQWYKPCVPDDLHWLVWEILGEEAKKEVTLDLKENGVEGYEIKIVEWYSFDHDLALKLIRFIDKDTQSKKVAVRSLKASEYLKRFISVVSKNYERLWDMDIVVLINLSSTKEP